MLKIGAFQQSHTKTKRGHSQLLDHSCGTAFRPTYDTPTLSLISSAGR